MCYIPCVVEKTAFEKDRWGMNAEEFYSRFDPVRTGGLGPLRLRNLYFTYLVELRALAKAAPYLKQVIPDRLTFTPVPV